ncbi:MAG: dihydrodipicolinate synthase family protein [Hyphomicrobiales bacterium]
MSNFHGIYPMTFAFYGADGRLDREAMKQQVRWCLEAGSHGVACLGLGTEVSALSEAERISIMEWATQDINGAAPLMVTIAGKDLAEAKKQIEAAEAVGAGWIVIQPPLGAKPEEEELFDFFSALIASTKLPAGIQNVPEFLGVGLTPESVTRLAQKHENFTVMKGEGPVCDIRKYIEGTNGTVSIFNGRGGLELPDNLRAGCPGMVPSVDMVDKEVVIYEAFKAGDLDRAYALYRDLLPLIVFIMQSLNHYLCYGKVLGARRIGLDIPFSSRISPIVPDEFGLESLDRFTALASIE